MTIREMISSKRIGKTERGGFRLLVLDVQRYFYNKYGYTISRYLGELLANELYEKTPMNLYCQEYRCQKKGFSRQAPDIIWGVDDIDKQVEKSVKDLENKLVEFTCILALWG